MVSRFPSSVCGSIIIASLAAPAAVAIEIDGVGNGALDQPRVNTRLSFNGTVLDSDSEGLDDIFEELGLDPDLFGLSPINIEAYYDTGAGTGLFGGYTAEKFGIPLQPGATFTDVGVGGAEAFNLSQALTIEIGSKAPGIDGVYGHTFNNAVAAIGQPPASGNPILDAFDEIIEQLLQAQSDFNVLGMPYFENKVVVMDARALNQFAVTGEIGDTLPELFTHVYDHSNLPAWNPSNVQNPGVPTAGAVDLTLELNFANFSGLTTTSPGATPPNLAHNPMIGGDLPPQFNEAIDDRDDNPGVSITRGTASSEGTWLFDTGAAATIISVEQAEALGVFYRAGNEPSENGPVLLEGSNGVALDDQFTLQLGGVGGTITVAGFRLDRLVIPTASGEELVFLNAPVLVADIGIPDSTTPDPNDEFILDGVLGMNFFFATMELDGPIDLAGLAELTTIQGAFDFVVYDETNNLVQLIYSSAIPEPATLGLLLLAAAPLTLGRRRA